MKRATLFLAGSLLVACALAAAGCSSKCKEHDFTGEETVIRAATCSEEGSKTVKCVNCNEITTVTLPMTEHDFTGEETVTENPTCTAKGSKSVQCVNCTATTSMAIPEIPHDFTGEETVTENPTCTAKGSKSIQCINCTATTSVAIDEISHDFTGTERVTEDPTCTKEGSKSVQCKNCTATTTATISKIPHVFTGKETVIKAATCTNAGNKYVQCANCTATSMATIPVDPAAHKYGDYSYDYDKKEYTRSCLECNHNETASAGGEELPLLARTESELIGLIQTAAPESRIELANDVTITAGYLTLVLRLPDRGTLDLGGHTVTVKNNGGFIVEGTDVTLQNGKVVAEQLNGYAVFVGDEGENNRVTLRNLEAVGGINVYNCEATLYDCNVVANKHKYYALWADYGSTVTVESGVYQGGETACVHSYADADPALSGNVVINGGTLHGKIFATYCTTVNGGVINGDIVLTVYNNVNAKLVVNKNYAPKLNIVVGTNGFKRVDSVDERGNFVYETAPNE